MNVRVDHLEIATTTRFFRI